MATDPVCGMFVDERTAELKLVRENRTYYFCAQSCLEEFASPEKRLAGLRHRLAVAWPCAGAILLLTYLRAPSEWPWLALVLASVVQGYPGQPFYQGTWDALRGRVWNMDVLIAVGTTVAYAYSAVALVLPSRLPPEYFFDASSFIITLILTGNYLEHLTRERARGALRSLGELLPSAAHVVRGGSEVDTPLGEVELGDRVRVRPGERFPVDGRILEGRSSAVEALLTGESLPVAKQRGDAVIAGSVNGDGALLVEATGVGPDTFTAHIGQLVSEAESSRVPLQQLADRIASRFVPLVLTLALLAGAAWYLAGAGGTTALLVFVSVAITACPCAFGLATPAALMVGTRRAAEEGVLFKGRDSLERASRIDLVLCDKTGTLTVGRPAVVRVLPAEGRSVEEVLALASGLERSSEHPLARGVLEAARQKGVIPMVVEEVQAIPGEGVRGTYRGVGVAISRRPPAEGLPGLAGSASSPREAVEGEGRTCSVLTEAGKPVGVLEFADPVAPHAQEAVATLRALGLPVVMVTGDHRRAADLVAQAVGIQEVHAGATPQTKLALIRRLREEGKRVAFVGDGINDAPSLAAADLGIAIGSGTEVAKETGGVVLVRSDLRGVATALSMGRRTVRKVRGNLEWAIGYNAVLLPVAAGALVPFFGLGVYQVLPMAGALAMGLSSTSVVLNSLSLRSDG